MVNYQKSRRFTTINEMSIRLLAYIKRKKINNSIFSKVSLESKKKISFDRQTGLFFKRPNKDNFSNTKKTELIEFVKTIDKKRRKLN